MGLVVTFVASANLAAHDAKRCGDPPQWLVYSAFGVGAVVQACSPGGALINVYVLTRIRDKSMFRATMVMVWLITNTISLMFRMFVLHSYTRQIWTNVLYSIPLVFIAFFIGNKLHHRIPNEKFANFVYIVQLISVFVDAGGINLLM